MEENIRDIIEDKYIDYLNGEIDGLGLTIEETIFILEKDKKEHFEEALLQEAYKVILSDYKRVSKENEKQQKLIDKMKKFLLKENRMCDFLEINSLEETEE